MSVDDEPQQRSADDKPDRPSIVEAFKALREAGGHYWDAIPDPAEYLGYKDVCLEPNEVFIVFAALASMVIDNHAVQDSLTEEQWALAQTLWERVQTYVDTEGR